MGITPAHAGKTRGDRYSVRLAQDHPRSRGKDSNLSISHLRNVGSPPLTRERPCRKASTRKKDRITPAHAGKTCEIRHAQVKKQDHPRSRGKDFSHNSSIGMSRGSPPLTRERLQQDSIPPARQRITPAHAGKTPGRLKFFSVARDHPRSRGKDQGVAECLTAIQGSPPLTRERLLCGRRFRSAAGITPAHAGKTTMVLRFIVRLKDHPRSRGKDLRNSP